MDIDALRAIFTTMPVDVVAAVLFATAVTVLTLRMGASIAIAFSLALIVGNLLFAALPNTFLIGSLVSSATSPTVAAGIYSALVVVLAAIFYRMTAALSDESSRPFFAIAAGLATTVVVLTMWHITPLQSFWSFNAVIQGVFGEAYRLYWLFLAFIAFAFVKS